MAPQAHSASNSSTSPLIAVLLVTSTSRGENLVFSFPKRPHLLKRYSRIRYYATNQTQANTRAEQEERRDSRRVEKIRQPSLSHPTTRGGNASSHSLDPNPEIDVIAEQKQSRQESFDTSDGEVPKSQRSVRDRDRGRDKQANSSDRYLADRDRDQQEEDDAESDEDQEYLDGLTDSDHESGAGSSTDDLQGEDLTGGDSSEEDAGGSVKERFNRFSTTNNIDKERQSRSQTRDKAIGERTSKSRVRSSSRSRTRQATSSVGGDTNNGNNRASKSNRRTSSSTTRKSYTEFLGYPIEVLAALLAPRRELCQQKFELIVDDLAFLGHPVCVGEDGVWSEGTDHASNEEEDRDSLEDGDLEEGVDDRGRTRETKRGTQSGPTELDSTTAIIGATSHSVQSQAPTSYHHVPSTSNHHVHYDETSEIHPHSSREHHHQDSRAASLRSSSQSPSRYFNSDSRSTNQKSISHPTLNSHDSTSNKQSRSRSKSRSKTPSSLTLFHLVLVLSRPSTNPPGSNSTSAIGSTTSTSLNGPDSISLSSWLQFWYDNVAFKMAAALYAEQCRCGYVGNETERLVALRERCGEDGASFSSYMTQALATSSLARSLRDLHTSIARSSGAFVSVNDTIDAHLQLPPLIHDPTRISNALDVQTELDGNDPVFLAGEGRPELINTSPANINGDEEQEEIFDPDGPFQRAEEKKQHLRKLRKSDNNLMLPEQFTFIEYTRTTGPFLLPWKTLLILNDRPNPDSSSSREVRQKTGKGRRRKRNEENDEAVTEDDDEEGDEDGEMPSNREEDFALPSSGIENWSRKFTSMLKPTLSGVPTFAELADLLEWDLYEDVYPMARHLIYYREARVVDVPRINSTYAISPMLDLEDLPQLSNYWSSTFPNLQSLPSLLSALSYSLQPLSSHFQILSQRSVDSGAADAALGSPSNNGPFNENTAPTPQRPQTSSHRLRLVATEAVKRKALDLRVQRIEKRREALQKRNAREEKRLRKIEKLRATALRHAGTRAEQDAVKDSARRRLGSRSRSGSDPPPTDSSASQQQQSGPRRGSASSRDLVAGLMSATRPSSAEQTRSKTSSSSHNSRNSRSGHPSHTPPVTQHQKLNRLSPESRKVDSLRFERRPISRSRSPSMLLERNPALASLTSTTSPTLMSPSAPVGISGAVSLSGSGSASAGPGPGSGSGSRPGTPRGRLISPNTSINAINSRDRSISSVEAAGSGNNSLPNSAGWSRRGRKSRSPSRARMMIKGFGEDEEIIVDDASGDAVDEEGLEKGSALKTFNENTTDGEDRLEGRTSSSTSQAVEEQQAKEIGLGLTLDSTKQTKSEILPPLVPSSDQMSSAQPLVFAKDAENSASQNQEPVLQIDALRSSSPSSCFSSETDCEDDSPGDDDLDLDLDFDDTIDQARQKGWGDLDLEPSLISEPSRADKTESEWIVAMLDGKEEWVTQRFLRLLPYLNGKHTVDEIVYREELRRRELRAILSQLSEEIITFVHP